MIYVVSDMFLELKTSLFLSWFSFLDISGNSSGLFLLYVETYGKVSEGKYLW